MKTKTHFAFRVDIWDDTGDSIVEHVAGVDDFEVAEATAVAPGQRRALPCDRASGWYMIPGNAPLKSVISAKKASQKSSA